MAQFEVLNQLSPVDKTPENFTEPAELRAETVPSTSSRITDPALLLALTVPSQAVIMSPRGKTVYVVGADDKVIAKPVKVIYDYQGISVLDGIAAGDRIVVEGKQNLRPGGKIREAKVVSLPPTETPNNLEKK